MAGQHTNRVILVTFEILLICRISPFGVMVGFTTQCPPMWVPPMADLQLDVNVFILALSQHCKFHSIPLFFLYNLFIGLNYVDYP